METQHIVNKIYSFLHQIGIPFQETDIEITTFLPGIRIEAGKLEIDRQKLQHPGDILHEAGHLALTEPARRATLDQAEMDKGNAQESEEIGVLLWTYLAAKHLDMPAEIVFHAEGYRGQSQWLMDNFNQGYYIGLPLLKWMGVVENVPEGTLPKVVNWLRQNQSN